MQSLRAWLTAFVQRLLYKRGGYLDWLIYGHLAPSPPRMTFQTHLPFICEGLSEGVLTRLIIWRFRRFLFVAPIYSL